jgi:probable DNA repair protein
LGHVLEWEKALSAAGWPGSRGLDSVEYQAFSLWQRVVRTVTSWDVLQDSWSGSEALAVLESLLQKIVFQPETQDQTIQVLGTLEAAGLHFDDVIVLDAVAGHFPERIAMSPFLPKVLQREHHLPRSDENQEYLLAKRLLEGMGARSNAIRFCYVAVADESRVLVTPILEELSQRACVVDQPSRSLIPGQWYECTESRGLALGSDNNDRRGGAHRIGMQALCPMQAYSRYRLHIPEQALAPEGLSHQEQGLILHKAMELLWLGKSRLDQIESVNITAAVTSALRKIAPARQALLSPLALVAEQLRLEKAINAWLVLEARREPFSVVEHEHRIETSIGGWIFRLRIDRLDRLSDGTTVIFDYKSSAPSISSWFDGRLEQAQLPLYALALGEQVSGVAFAQVSSTKPAKLSGVSDRAFAKGVKVIEGWSEQQRYWEHALGELIAEAEVGEASARPSLKSCRYCHYASICRVRVVEDCEVETDE